MSSGPIRPQETETVRRRVGEHLREHGTLDGLAVDGKRPDPLHPLVFIGRTPAAKSRLAYHRCSFCETDRKFSRGFIVLCGDRHLRLIGPECWKSSRDADRFAAGRADFLNYEIECRFFRVKDRLAEELGQTAIELRRSVRQRQNWIAFAEKAHHAMANGNSALWREILEASRNSGQLTVERLVREKRGQQERSYWTRVPVAGLMGVTALVRPISGITAVLDKAADKCLTLRDRVQTLARDGEENSSRVARAFMLIAKEIDPVQAPLVNLAERLRNLSLFFSPDNLASLERWATDEECSAMAYSRIEITPRVLRYGEQGSGSFDLNLEIPEGFATWRIPTLEEAKSLTRLK